MSAFHDVLLPLPFSLGATCSIERRVDIVTLGSGREARNTPWAHGRRRYDIAGAARTLDEIQALIGFYEARRGRLHGFRFRDFLDWKSSAPSAPITPGDQPIGAGDGAANTFLLVKVYGEGDDAYVRPIRKPVAGSVRVALDGVELAPAEFTADETSGLVTLAAPPGSGVAVSAGFLFDTPVRFDSERLDLGIESINAARTIAAPMIEIAV